MGHPNQSAREETDRWLNSGNQLDRICQGIKRFLEVISIWASVKHWNVVLLRLSNERRGLRE